MVLGVHVVSELIKYCQLGNYFQFCRGYQENLLFQNELKGQYMVRWCHRRFCVSKLNAESVYGWVSLWGKAFVSK